jgi:ABC-type branched-subunit amino acid transport system ATPase component
VTLIATGLCVYYGRAMALADVSLCAPAGQATAVLGYNGSGKTSLLRAIGGLLTPARGTVSWDKEPIPAIAFRAANGWLRLVPESGNVFAELSIEDNLKAGLLGLSRPERDERVNWILTEFPVLRPLLRRRAGQLSGGQRQSLAVARAVVARPRLLLLDEPTLGLSPKAGSDLLATIGRVTSELNMTVLLAEQNVGLAMEVCANGWWLDAGRIVSELGRSDSQ